jgi:hypothetical protein
MNLHIEALNDTNIDKWENFNHEMNEGTFYHTTKWKKILESLGHISHYYLIFSGDEVVAICPFFEFNIKGFKGITTLPESDYNHLIIKDNDPHIINYIIKELESKAKKNSWSFIILNSLDKNFENKLNASFYPNFSMGTMILDIKKLNPDKIWNEIFNAKKGQRRYIKRFENDGFKIRELDSKKDIKVLYEYYQRNIKHINGTEYPYSHFMDLYNIYPSKNLHSALLCKEDFVAGGFLNFLDESTKTLYSRYIAINRDLPNKYHIQYPLLWESIKKANELGYKRVSFGSNVNDQSHPGYRIKKNFGAEYLNSYSILRPISRLFKLGHNVYRSINPVHNYEK